MPSALFRQFILKVHNRCDLACDHCYVFEHADQSWRNRPAVMSTRTMRRAAERIAEHAREHGLAEVCLVLHGGEPLLAGPDRLGELITAAREPLRGICDVEFRLHTNGVLLDTGFCELFRREGVLVGVSLDGDRAANDRHRLYRDGRSSYDKAVRAIGLLRHDFPELYSGLLCTIDVANDPIAVYEALLDHEPPAIDFLLPHHTWDDPPPRPTVTAYADWLSAIFDRWLAGGRPVPVRTFDSIINAGRGGPSLTESLGLEAGDLVVIESDGGYEQADSLKTAYDGAPETGMDVFRHSVDEVGRHAGVAEGRGGLAALCEVCRSCPVVAVCGGGLRAHRYRGDSSGFANPSVYCEDLSALIAHVQRGSARRLGALPAPVLRSLATGYGDPAAIAWLRRSQTVGGRALLAAVGARSEAPAAWNTLREVEGLAPSALDAVLAHPYVRVRAVRRLRSLEESDDRTDDGLLATVACVAAAKAGTRSTLTVPVRDGDVYLPTVGRYRVPGRERTTVQVGDGRFTVEGATGMDPVRRLRAGAASVALDDLDPFRDCHDWPASERLDEERFQEWQTCFQQAWELLEKDYGEYAPGIAEALTTIVPLDVPHPGSNVSSAARDAFGAVGIALPEDPATLCLLLLHEFQHVKLGAVLDFVDLYDRNDERRFHAPWREDPRPLEGLLQGTYAHIAVADFWRRRCRVPQADTVAEAERHFGKWYPETLAAVGTLQSSEALTGLGEQFVALMRATLESWDPSVPTARSD
ncbi:hypothetical protein GCM10009678_31650 [Actinomadura kijaniata]|nr:FxsB family cyclophane-forming radical SAM/SPASM peptide maturase [Actinomadura namibiensis]